MATPEDRKYEQDMEIWRHDVRWNEVSWTNAMASASAAIRAMMFINGGAAVALLALMGTIDVSSGRAPSTAPLVAGLLQFAAGVFTAALATGMAFASQVARMHSEARTRSARTEDDPKELALDLKLGPRLAKIALVIELVLVGLWLASAVFFLDGAQAAARYF